LIMSEQRRWNFSRIFRVGETRGGQHRKW
jgi:hypothetical protein